MRILLFGNSGSGKTVCAQRLAAAQGLARLDLDTIVWLPGAGATQRPAQAVVADLQQFIDRHQNWVIEGCYGELIETAAARCTELVFLNPGLATCVDNSRRRLWEAHKYASPAEQDAALPALLDWVRGYYTRDDSWSCAYHRRLFDAFAGAKRELTVLPSST